MNKKIIVLGGGTFSHVRSHLSLSAPAFGRTACQLFDLLDTQVTGISGGKVQGFSDKFHMDVDLVLTKMANSDSNIVTNDDVKQYVDSLIDDNTTKVIFFSAAMCDFDGQVGAAVEAGKYAERLRSASGERRMTLTPANKVISTIRQKRKDIFLVGFKTTCGVSQQAQFVLALDLLKKASCNLVVANDVKTRSCFIVTPEEAVYGENMTRDEMLKELVDMVYWRTHLSFTRSTVVDGSPMPWSDVRGIFPALTTVVEHCIKSGAYKPFNGATVGHFAAKLPFTEYGKNAFVTSIRKTNFNDIQKNGMVVVRTDGDDSVIAFGAKPSVGGQSQRIIFGNHPDTDCIVHFHCPLLGNPRDLVPVVSQREYECGSHQCGQNTSDGLGKFGNLHCVMLDKHGPNIVFNHAINPQEVIDFIDANFDLAGTTRGFQQVMSFLKTTPQTVLEDAQDLLS